MDHTISGEILVRKVTFALYKSLRSHFLPENETPLTRPNFYGPSDLGDLGDFVDKKVTAKAFVQIK